MRRSVGILASASFLCLIAAQPAAAQRNHTYDKALGLAVGLADASSGTETVLSAGFRFRIAGPPAERDSRGSMRGFLEPEVQQLESESSIDSFEVKSEDLSVGVNIVGVVPFGAVDTFFGGGPVLHFLDASSELTGLESSSEEFGLNIHVGVDVHLSDRVALTVAGRLDLIEDAIDEELTKILLGFRFKWK